MAKKAGPTKSTLRRFGDVVFVYVTFPTASAAKTLGEKSIELGLSACVNIFSPHHSIYRWNGKVESAIEVATLFKTSRAKLKALCLYIETNHPFDVPCVATFNPTEVSRAFAGWIVKATVETTVEADNEKTVQKNQPRAVSKTRAKAPSRPKRSPS